MIQLNAQAVDGNGLPVPAIVTLDLFDGTTYAPASIEPNPREGTGIINFYNGPALGEAGYPWAHGMMAAFTVLAPGIGVGYVGPQPFGTASLTVTVPIAPFKRPFRPMPRVWAANLCGIRIPGLPAVPGGAADASLFLSWFYDRYDPVTRETIRAAMHGAGFTHWILSWPDSRSHGATPASFLATCRELLSAGFFPCVFLSSKDDDPMNNAAGVLANIAPVVPLLIGTVPAFCLGWELNLWNSPTDVATLRDTLAPQILSAQPGTLVYVHFSAGVFAWQQPGDDTAAFWNASVGKLTGILHQRDQTEDQGDMSQYQARLTDCLVRFNGADGFVTDSGFGHPFDVVACEITADQVFNGQMPQSQQGAWAQAAISTPAQGGVKVLGSGNG